MNKEKLQHFLRQYFNNSISTDDCIELLNYLNSANPDEIDDLIDPELFLPDEGPEFRDRQAQEVFNRIKADPRFIASSVGRAYYKPKVVRFYNKRWLQIAAIFLVCCTALYFLKNKHNYQATGDNVAKTQAPALIVPGGNKATLTLANGKVIVLQGANNGLIAKSGGINVVKVREGKLVYNTLPNHGNANTANNGPVYNTLSTPKGGEYQVMLPDGTKVWLNSASSLSYPTEFTGNERHVKLTGEAYFEVAKNKDKPFYVNINTTEVRVLGTHFNISAYSDDKQITTTLLEGAVRVTRNNKQSLLKPGQQAVVNNNTGDIAVSEANIAEAMAWKNGYFIFDDDNITGIMKKVSRWYDVEVEYHGNLENQRFGGTYHRFKSINELLIHLETIGKIHFKIMGRRIIVME